MTYAIPGTSVLSQKSYQYIDSFSISLRNNPEILDVSKALFLSTPIWVRRLMSFRNTLVQKVGLKTSDEPNDADQIIQNFDGQIGSAIGLFEVFDRSENEIVFGQNDRHLNFRASLLINSGQAGGSELYFTTGVDFHNVLGKAYFLVVKPFHKVIVKSMLKSTKKHLEN